ncbi:transmembrane 9 superfamily member 7-like [Zingiber officinale]|uniref:transmembrane 9 superfamily member 7-like n=1 Tax=Zingiber officinale TaxID=94328 RepID=UPI001C4B278B|nr:transmembrane 9 superfamily member 7-like [Zingiber officinale]
MGESTPPLRLESDSIGASEIKLHFLFCPRLHSDFFLLPRSLSSRWLPFLFNKVVFSGSATRSRSLLQLFAPSLAMEKVRGEFLASLLLAFLLLLPSCRAFYLPGVTPRDFHKGADLQVKVNKLSSTKTQLPYDYYFLDYCKPSNIINSAENLGEVLRGDRIENSVYTFKMRVDEGCKVVCRVNFSSEIAKNFKEKIDDDYSVNMILDNLPLAVPRQRRDGSQIHSYENGFRVGYKGRDNKYYLSNHLSFRVMYHKDAESDDARIVGFEATPSSVKHDYTDWDDKNPKVSSCTSDSKISPGSNVPQEVAEDAHVVFSYDVTFQSSDIKWASRWDTYLLMNDDQIHWFSIINSLMIVLFLSGMVAMIMLRTLYRDIANYNQLESQDEAQEETGWKLVHGDVFRPPLNSGLLCVYVGTGVQFFGMTLVTMIFALLGFLSPSNRGGLMTAMVLLWVFMGIFAGYASARLYKMFKGSEWKRITLKTASMFPGIVFAIFFVLNALIWGEKSSGAVPFGTMFALVFLWFGISVPLVFVGSYIGYKRPALEDPVKTNKIPRQIPEQAWYLQPAFSILIGGILPFGAVFIELFFILTSIWLNQFYYIFGFLFLVFLILIITCAEITIVLCYFQLCSEDYHWWWRAYLTAGSSAVYLFAYSAFYFVTKLEITKFVSGILYFGYMLIASYAFFVLTGTMGFYACFWFVRKIYSSVKID